MALVSLLLATAALAPTLDPVDSRALTDAVYDKTMIDKTPAIAVPSGYGRYCSLTYPNGGWAFDWGSATDDPCATMLASSPGGKIARAGLYATSENNNIVVRCGGGVGLYKLKGGAGLQSAFDENKSQKNCVFTVAPKNLNIFHAPYATSADDVTYTNLFNFARGYKVKTNAGVESNNVNYKGVGVNYDHDGFDWPMDEGTLVESVHKGLVLAARTRDVTKYCPNVPDTGQKEAYVLHKIGTGVYAELFVSYYAHFHALNVQAGDIVSRGSALGTVGSSGCSSGPHVHFEMNRMSNTAASYRRHLRVPATEDYDPTTPIDPYGWAWSAKAGFDPWAWRAYDKGQGALSISLWAEGQRPPRD